MAYLFATGQLMSLKLAVLISLAPHMTVMTWAHHHKHDLPFTENWAYNSPVLGPTRRDEVQQSEDHEPTEALWQSQGPDLQVRESAAEAATLAPDLSAKPSEHPLGSSVHPSVEVRKLQELERVQYPWRVFPSARSSLRCLESFDDLRLCRCPSSFLSATWGVQSPKKSCTAFCPPPPE